MMRLAGLAAALLLLAAGPACAHPHVWVTTKADIVFAPDGRLLGIRHHWTFDRAYSAFSVQNLGSQGGSGPSPDELRGLAKENVESLADYGWFTMLKAAGTRQSFDPPRDYGMTYTDGQTTLDFFLPLKQPTKIGRSLRLDVYDPTFFVDFEIAEGDAVHLLDAPSGCTLDIRRPKPLAATAQPQPVSEAFFQALTAVQDYGAKFSNGVLVGCP